ncbi:MAG: hypothetical protein EOM93_06485 [Gammaproteobacteria bacterium]|nr:hypothetical protein [Gammaproteobacteria bacterium]
MERFSDFAESSEPLDGDKIKLDDVLNREIVVLGYRVKESKYPKSGDKCLTLQISMDEKRCVVFTGSGVLLEQVEKYQEKIPFIATIKKIDRYYTFT